MTVLLLATKDNVKALHKEWSDAKHDGALDLIIPAVSRQIESAAGVGLYTESRTQVFDVELGQQRFLLNSLDITTITSVKTSTDRDFDTAGKFTLVDPEDYTVESVRGRLTIDRWNMAAGVGAMQVVHTGGIGTTPSDVLTSWPDLVLACAMQVIHIYKKAPHFGFTARSGNTGSRTFEQGANLLQAVREYVEGFLADHQRRLVYD